MHAWYEVSASTDFDEILDISPSWSPLSYIFEPRRHTHNEIRFHFVKVEAHFESFLGTC